MRCNTCHQESALVKRVVVDRAYNRALARALYNCPACFDRKERTRSAEAPDAAPAKAAARKRAS